MQGKRGSTLFESEFSPAVFSDVTRCQADLL